MGYILANDKTIGSEEVLRNAARAATGFLRMGIVEGDTIAICLRNDLAFLEANFGASIIGAYPVSVNWHSAKEEAVYLLTDSEAKILVIHADLLPRIAAAVPAHVRILVVPTSEEIRRNYGVAESSMEIPAGALRWDTWLESQPPRAVSGTIPFSTMTYTSGTTGRPKGVRRVPATAEQTAGIISVLARCYGFADYAHKPAEITTLITGPLYHMAPNAHASMALRVGANIIMTSRFDAEDLLRMIEKHRITHLHMVPIMFVRLLRLPEEVRRRYDLSSLRYVVHAAAPCPSPVKRQMIEWWGPVINEYYGSTESGNICMCNSEQWLSHPGTVGKVFPEADVRVFDEHGRDAGPGVVGEVGVRFSVFPDFTYQGDPEKRRRAEKYGYIIPGDVGYFDDDGFLYLCDRSTDMIISGGVNIYPAEIEAELLKLPGIADCAVFGIPDEEYGERVCAYLQPMPNVTLDTAALVNEMRSRMAGFKVPKIMEVREELPREDSGKVFKRKLREPYWVNQERRI